MNIFEFLDLPKDHRIGKKIVQHVKHWDDVVASKRDQYPYFGQIKKDGVFCLLVRYSGKVGAFGRSGLQLVNVNTPIWLSNQDGVYIAELCDDTVELAVLSGRVNPNRLKEAPVEHFVNQYLAFHDFMVVADFVDGLSQFKYSQRLAHLAYMAPTESIITSYEIRNCKEKADFTNKAIESGEEGVVYKLDSEWVAGHKGYRSMKEVREITFDLRCVAIEEGTGKYEGKAVNLLFEWKDGKQIKAMLGKGWTHEDAEDIFQNPLSAIGEVYEVYALQESSKGLLRNPKVGEHRHDKTEPDYGK